MNNFKNFVDSCLAKNSKLHAYMVGFINEQAATVLNKYNIEIATQEIYLTQKGLTHLYRPTKQKASKALLLEDIYTIPTILSEPS